MQAPRMGAHLCGSRDASRAREMIAGSCQSCAGCTLIWGGGADGWDLSKGWRRAESGWWEAARVRGIVVGVDGPARDALRLEERDADGRGSVWRRGDGGRKAARRRWRYSRSSYAKGIPLTMNKAVDLLATTNRSRLDFKQ